MEKLEIERISKIKELEEIEAIKKRIRRTIKNINETVNIPKEMLLTCFFKTCLSINKTSKRK